MYSWIEELDPNLKYNKNLNVQTPIKTMDMDLKTQSLKLDLNSLQKRVEEFDNNETIENNDICMSPKEKEILSNYLNDNLKVENHPLESPNRNFNLDESSEMSTSLNDSSDQEKKHQELINKVNQLHSKLKLAKSNLKDKEQHIETLQKQLLSARKSFEEVPKQYEEQLSLMTENLRIIKEDTQKDNSLIAELFNKDQKVPVPKFNKQGYLDLIKQLDTSREVSRAHMSHNRYLSQEIDRIQHEHKITINRYKQILESCSIEIDLLTKENQRLQIAQKYYTAKFDLDAPEVEEMDQQIINVQQYQMMKEEFDWLKKSYFVSYALGVKMSIQMALSKNVNFNVHELYDEAIEKGVPMRDWSQWITRRLMDN